MYFLQMTIFVFLSPKEYFNNEKDFLKLNSEKLSHIHYRSFLQNRSKP